MHLIVDGVAQNKVLMTTVPMLRNWLMLLAEAADMRVHGEPMVTGYPWPGSCDESALSGICFLKESSITVHCYPERSHVFIDVFSCRGFNAGSVTDYIRETMQMPVPEILVLQRGLEGFVPLRTEVVALQ